MSPAYLPFVDWMKAAGMALIVWGHVNAPANAALSPPFYPKQLGVAFFVFLTGFTLARETRPRWQVVFNRAFEPLVVGAVFALGTSVVGLLVWGDAFLSNVLPLAGGLHVFQDAFPVNPTTWYIGTYLHLLLVWALLLRGRTLTPLQIGCGALAEIGIRAQLMQYAGPYVAYMLFVNWWTVLLVGLWFGARATSLPTRGMVPAVLFVVGWPLLAGRIEWTATFPFMTLDVPGAAARQFASLLVTSGYLFFTLSALVLLGRLPADWWVRMFARNTVVVFVGHMPLYYGLERLLLPLVPAHLPRTLIEMAVCFVLLALASEAVRGLVDLRDLRERVFGLFGARTVREGAA
ncbi:MAG: acyltransferase [Acidimicrobiia bacterium]|nr:acyltransferase [Acidimicrobiia bacterium]